MTTTRPEWVPLALDRLKQWNPEYSEANYPHVALLVTIGENEYVWATLDSFGDVLHCAMFNGSFMAEKVDTKTDDDIVDWFNEKVFHMASTNIPLLREAVASLENEK